MAEKLFYIQNKGFVGNCLLWWGPEGKGYTTDLDKAGKYTVAEAIRRCSSRPEQDFYHPVDVVDAQAVRHVREIGSYE
jgi:hypothetical protein